MTATMCRTLRYVDSFPLTFSAMRNSWLSDSGDYEEFISPFGSIRQTYRRKDVIDAINLSDELPFLSVNLGSLLSILRDSARTRTACSSDCLSEAESVIGIDAKMKLRFSRYTM
jgi:hypothetical protein